MDQRDLRFLDPAMTPVLPIIKKVFEKRVPKFSRIYRRQGVVQAQYVFSSPFRKRG